VKGLGKKKKKNTQKMWGKDMAFRNHRSRSAVWKKNVGRKTTGKLEAKKGK